MDTENQPMNAQDPVPAQLPVRVEAGALATQPKTSLAPLTYLPAVHGSKPMRFAVTPAKLKEAFLFRWKLALLAGLLLASVGAGLAWLTYKPKYVAVALLRITSSKPRLLPGTLPERERRDEFQKTEAQMIKGRNVLAAVVKRDQIRGLAMIRAEDNPVLWLEKELQTGFISGTDILRIALTGDNPEELALIVNAVKSVYRTQFVEGNTKEEAGKLSAITEAMGEAELKINDRLKTLSNLAKAHKTGDSETMSAKEKMAINQLAMLSGELYTVQRKMREVQSRANLNQNALNLADKEKIPPDLIDEFLERHPQVRRQKLEVARLEEQVKENRKYFTDDKNSRMRQLLAELDGAKAKLKDLSSQPETEKEIRAFIKRQRENALRVDQKELALLADQENAVHGLVDKAEKEAGRIGLDNFEFRNLRRDLDSAEAVHKKLLAEKERIEIERFNKGDFITGEQDAEVPTVNQASLAKMVSFYSIAGLLLGFLGIAYLEARLHRVHQSAEVQQDLGIHTLGILPLISAKDAGVYGPALAVANSVPGIVFTEAVNSLCARLLCDDRLNDHAVIMVTSAGEDEGKTLLATQLAAGLARSGRKTLLLDCDFRKPACHLHLDVTPGAGVSDILCGDVDFDSALQSVPDSELRFLSAGPNKPQVIKALSTGGFAALLAQARREFDYVIVDSAPTPVVADGYLIGKLADGVILVVRPKVSKGPAVVAACEQLAVLRIPILGAVVNANPSRGSVYYFG